MIKTEELPDYLHKLIKAFEEQQSKVCISEPEIEIFGEGKQYRSAVSVAGLVVVGLEKIKTPDKSAFVVLSRFSTKKSAVPRISLGFPIYIPTIKSHAWPGVVSMVAVIKEGISNTVVLTRIGGWRKRAVFVPILPSFSDLQSAYNDKDRWDPLTRELNSDKSLLNIDKGRWDGGMQELELHIKTKAQLIQYQGKTIFEYSVLPKASGFWATGYRWDFRLEEGLNVFERFVEHIKSIPKSDSRDVKGRIFDETSLALQDVLKRDTGGFQGL